MFFFCVSIFPIVFLCFSHVPMGFPMVFSWITPRAFLAVERLRNASEAAAVMSRYDALLNRPEVQFQHRYEAKEFWSFGVFEPAGCGYYEWPNFNGLW